MRTVVVGTDGSPCADQAVVWAAEDAVRRGCDLHVVHSSASRLSGIRPPNETLGRQDSAQRLLLLAETLAWHTHPGLHVTGELSDRPVTEALSRYRGRAAAIVIGHRGRDGYRGLLLGSTGLSLAGRLPGPVIIVRGATDGEHATIVCGLDPYDPSEAALEFAGETAAAYRSRLVVAEIWSTPRSLRDGSHPSLQRNAIKDAAERLNETVAPWREKFPEVEIHTRVVRGHEVRGLIDLSATADLLVVGSRGLGRLQSACVGSVSHGVMHHALCPVAVVGR